MAAAQPCFVVSSLSEALEQSSKFDGAIAFMVAPLQVRSGGQRKWHGLDPDAHRWMAESETTGEKEPKLPLIDEGAENLPELPESKIGLWELSFIDKDLNHLRPRVRIDAAEGPASSSVSAGSPASSSVSADLLATIIRDQHRACMDSQKASRDMLASVSEHQKRLTEQLQQELTRACTRAAEAELVRDKAIAANGELHHALAQHESNNLVAVTLQKVFEGEPDKFTSAVAMLLKGAVDMLRGSSAAAG
jgi:hypothetical protein